VPLLTLVPGDTVRIRDERWIVTRQSPGADASILDVRGRDRSNLNTCASFLLPFEVVEPLTSDRSARLVGPRRWRRLTRALLTTATPSWSSLRTPLHARISLLPFQLEPALAVTHGMACRILIADEVGLGKTVQAALIVTEILERARHGRVLIVAPAALKEQWHAELRDRFSVDAWLADSASLARFGTARGIVNPWIGRPVTITSIDFVKRPEVMRSLEALVWDAVVFDEAHGLAGHSDRSAAAGLLAKRARTVVLLTATPHSGNDRSFDLLREIGDLDSQFPLLTFRRTRLDVGLAVSRRTTTLHVRLTLTERELHRALQAYVRTVRRERRHEGDAAHLAMMVLTRRACSSAASLARSIERRLDLLPGGGAGAAPQMRLPLFDVADDEEPGAELAAPGLDDRDEERRWLHRILLLARRAESNESKLRVVMRLLRRAGEPAIVFTEYRDTLVRVAAVLRDFSPVTLHGALTAHERRDSLRMFTGGTTRLLLATDAASEGLNLQQRCRLVINLEVPWTPTRVEQRIGRVERIGQTQRVHAVHLVAAGTPEETYAASLSIRTSRVAGALDRLRDSSPESLRLRTIACAEANRLEQLRSMCDAPDGGIPEARPHAIRRRRRTTTRGDIWAFRLSFIVGEQLVWHTLIGVVTATSLARSPFAWSIDDTARLIASTVDAGQERALASLERGSRGHLDLAAQRERAIAHTIETEQARLSAALLQPNLFDRRSDRAFAAQRAVRDEALCRCRARLDEIAATSLIAVEPVRLACALVRR